MADPAPKESLEVTKTDIGLGYGDAAIIGQRIMRCLEYEFAQRDDRIAALEARLADREATT